MLAIIAEIAKMCCETAHKISCIRTSIQFIQEGNVSKTLHRNRYKPTLLDSCMDIDQQLTFPMEITSTRQYPDLVIWFVNSKKVIIAELMIPFEVNIDWVHQNWKSTKTCGSSVLRMAGQQTYFLLRLDVKVLFQTQPLHF